MRGGVAGKFEGEFPWSRGWLSSLLIVSGILLPPSRLSENLIIWAFIAIYIAICPKPKRFQISFSSISLSSYLSSSSLSHSKPGCRLLSFAECLNVWGFLTLPFLSTLRRVHVPGWTRMMMSYVLPHFKVQGTIVLWRIFTDFRTFTNFEMYFQEYVETLRQG